MSGSPTSGDQTERLRRAFQALEQMETRFRAMERAANEPIAVIGLGCRFPGGCDNPDSYWKFLKDGRDAVTTVPVDRWDIEEYFSKDREAAGKTYVREGAYLTGIDLFDAEFFGISPREATSLDPQQRLLLEVFWEALENAGLDSRKLEGTKTGIFVGIGQNEYAQLELHAGDLNSLHPYAGSGNGFAFASGRISYVLGLRGPNMAVDTACSSSLVAVHLACQSLRRGESTLAIAGGVHLSLLPLGSVFMARTGALAADGRCKTFDAAADGFGRGEGCGAVVLKKLSQAIADNDQIWAVIPGSAVNHDGASSGLMVPSEEAQEQLLRSALADAGKKPADISYLEAHGTGTVLGDPIELGAVKSVFSDRVDPLWIGSVKTNFGHLEAASGIAGLIKVILALKNQELPRHLHFKLPNPHISWSETPFQIPTASVRWEAERRCAGVSAFGLSGTNAHVILESAPVRKSIASEKSPQLLILSASNFSALQELAARFQTFLQDAQEEQLGAICFTANTGRFVFDHRVAIVEDTKSQFAKALGLFVEGIPDSAYFSGKSHSTSNPSTKMPLRNSVSREQLLNLAQGVVKGENCDWESFYQGDNYVRVSLPTYCFQRKKYWVTPLLSRRADHLTKEEHPLLGYRLSTPLSILAFEKQFPEGKFGILGDHRFEGTPIMPAAGWIEMALAAGRIHLKQDQLSMSDGVIHRPLCLSGPIALQTHLRTEKPEQYLLEIFGKCDSTKQVSTWELHFSSRLKKATTFVESAVNPEDAKWGFFQSVDKKEVYKGFERLGLTYGAAFRTLSFISSGRDEAWAGIEGIHNLENGKYLINPAMLDGCFQSLGALFPEAEDTYLPLAIEHVEVVQCMPSSGWCHASVLEMTNSQIKADFRLYTAKGEWVASVRGFTSRKVNSKTKPKFSRLSYELKWKESSLQYSACTKGEQNWVVAGHECPLQEVITNKLKDSGCNIVKLSGLSTIHEARIVYLPPPQKSLSNKAENALAASLDLLNLLQSLPTGKSYRLCIVTCLAKWVVPADEPELNFGGLGGLAKAAANENRFLQVVEIDLGCGDEKEISLLIEELLASQDEREVAIRSGKRYLSQLERVGNKRTNDLSFALSQKETGTFETLEYGETETTLPGAKEVQIKVASAGLNFKDVLRALGMFQDEMPGCFGMECAGTVVAIGENVARFSVGDEVVAGLVPCALNGLVNATEDFVFLKPKNLSWHEASTIPIAFLTAWHGLINLAALKRGDRVLIHSAAGGVGQAAIQLALRVGAEVFATCSESKRSHIQAQGVRHIMDSRTTKFVDDIRSQTRG
ncbi:MAG: beta-ketoacyl synthase, partial [Verrucomicrobiales bacterium]|nr:beta-ketoacyl synthase [Verrucomicrobiales bacterium]